MTSQHSNPTLADSTTSTSPADAPAPDQILDAIDAAHGLVRHAIDTAFAAARAGTDDSAVLDAMKDVAAPVARFGAVFVTWARHVVDSVERNPEATTADLVHFFDYLSDLVSAPLAEQALPGAPAAYDAATGLRTADSVVAAIDTAAGLLEDASEVFPDTPRTADDVARTAIAVSAAIHHLGQLGGAMSEWAEALAHELETPDDAPVHRARRNFRRLSTEVLDLDSLLDPSIVALNRVTADVTA